MTLSVPNSQYNVAEPGSLPVKIAAYQRRKMYDHFLSRLRPTESDTILDVGVTSDRTYVSSNYLEAWYPHKHRIVAAGIDDASFLEAMYPGMQFVHANGLDLPFEDRSFDFVHSSAVLEHVGSTDNQIRLISECARVARKGIYLTTPNRWFPVEFHTVLPLVHWLPKTWFRALMRRTGRGFFADESNLNLMTPSEVREAVSRTDALSTFDWSVDTMRLGGWPSNIILWSSGVKSSFDDR